MIMRKICLSAMALAIAAAGLTGCGSSGAAAKDSGDRLSIVCTIFPEYDWVREIMGSHADEADITYLLDSGIDLHNFQPTADDIMKISTCDLFIHVGGESDKWTDDALREAVNKDMKVIDLMELTGDNAKEEEIKEGMEAEEEDGEEEEEIEYDEHVWLSLRNAKVICSGIADQLSAIDPENAGDYSSSLAAYEQKLDELDGRFSALAENTANGTLVFGDRFPFRYMVDDYGLDYYAAFVGCSAESEASFKTVCFLADKLNELDCDTLFTIENSDKSIAEAIIMNSGRENCTVAELDSLQSVSAEDVKNGATYLSLMQKNYDVLAGYLN